MRYYIKRDTNQFGPFTQDEVIELLAVGGINFTDLAAPEGSNDFRPLSQYNLSKTSKPVSSDPIHPTISPVYHPEPAFNGNHNSQVLPSQPLKDDGKESFQPLPKFENNTSTYITEDLGKPKRYRKKDLISETFEIIREKLFSWFIIAFIPFVLMIILMFKNFGIIMQQTLAPMINKSQVVLVNPQDLIQLIILGLLTFYTSITSIIMTISGTAEYKEGIDFTLSDLFVSVQPKIPKFFVISLLFGFGFSLIYIPISLLPIEIRPFALIISLIIYLFIVIRLLPLPMVVILDELGFIESFKLSYLITKNNIGRIFKLLLFVMICQIVIAIGTPFLGILGLIINLMFNIGVLILCTLFYLDLVERARFDGII